MVKCLLNVVLMQLRRTAFAISRCWNWTPSAICTKYFFGGNSERTTRAQVRLNVENVLEGYHGGGPHATGLESLKSSLPTHTQIHMYIYIYIIIYIYNYMHNWPPSWVDLVAACTCGFERRKLFRMRGAPLMHLCRAWAAAECCNAGAAFAEFLASFATPVVAVTRSGVSLL